MLISLGKSNDLIFRLSVRNTFRFHVQKKRPEVFLLLSRFFNQFYLRHWYIGSLFMLTIKEKSRSWLIRRSILPVACNIMEC